MPSRVSLSANAVITGFKKGFGIVDRWKFANWKWQIYKKFEPLFSTDLFMLL